MKLVNKILLFLDLTDVNDEASRWVDDKIDGIPKRPEEKPAWAKEKTKRKAFIEKNLKLRSKKINGNIGIAHTRWATHGEPSSLNAHPHISKNTVFFKTRTYIRSC